jgi:hypothetical protein
VKYKVKNGINYPDAAGKDKRAEIGNVVDDIPAKSVPWLIDQGHIEAMKEAPAPPAPAVAPAPVAPGPATGPSKTAV